MISALILNWGIPRFDRVHHKAEKDCTVADCHDSPVFADAKLPVLVAQEEWGALRPRRATAAGPAPGRFPNRPWPIGRIREPGRCQHRLQPFL